MMGAAKWDWEEAERVGKEVDRSPKTIVDCWREGRPIAPKASSHAKKTEQVNLALSVMMVEYDGFPQPRTVIGEVCGVTPEAIRYIENRALRKVREAARDVMKEVRG